jgi:hypothetical protein
MISVNFELRNPWSNRFNNLWCRSFATPVKNKFVELELYKDTNILSFRFTWTIRQDHAGLNLEVGLLGYCFHASLYDARHWDYEKGKWVSYVDPS